MDNTFFPFPSGCNLVFCRYTVKKIIDDIKIEKEKKMKGSYKIWVMTVMKKKQRHFETIGDDNGFDVTVLAVIGVMVIIASAAVVIMVGAAMYRDSDDYHSSITMEMSKVVMVKRR